MRPLQVEDGPPFPLQERGGGGGESSGLLGGRPGSFPTDAAAAAAAAAARRRRSARLWMLCLSAAAAAALLLSAAALRMAVAAAGRAGSAAAAAAAAAAAGGGGWGPITKIAFGSCTAYDMRPQRVWTEGVIPAAPDAWVWLGDMAYMDEPSVDCAMAAAGGRAFPECECAVDFIRRPPFMCFAANPQHARMRMNHQLSIPEYRAFLDFMCPPELRPGGYPPDGSDPKQCPRPVFGTWDDHDFGWNNGDGRNPAKAEMKAIYLDGLGLSQSSPRRSGAGGIQAYYPLPSRPPAPPGAPPHGPPSAKSGAEPAGAASGGGGGGAGGASPGSAPAANSGGIDLVLLDGRYDRETLPCAARRGWCEQVLAAGSRFKEGDADWETCRDLFVSGGVGEQGSCCRKDDEWTAWCAGPGAAGHPLRRTLCDPTSSDFAAAPYILGSDNLTVISGDLEAAWGDQRGGMWRRLVEGAASPVCEMLGASQRKWLRRVLASSAAPLKLIGSGSVLAGSIGHLDANGTSTCDGDDWACWPRAQVNLLHTIANASGCAIVLTGDYHISDIKVVMPGAPGGTNYSEALQTAGLRKPVWQVMASGLTRSTARSEAAPCKGSWLEDVAGLRPLGRCAYVPQPAFGMVQVDWPRGRARLSIRDASSGAVAIGKDGSRQEVEVDLETCLRA